MGEDSARNMSNKENFSAYKLEGANLSVEPMQMKKKKKGGGHNLRKSLAWNNAFFTEEGVLDPEELSIMIGTPGSSSRGVFSTISEERRNTPYDPQALGKNLFKDVQSSSAKKEKNAFSFLPKHNSPARGHGTTTSASPLRVLPNHDLRNTGTRDSGIQLPLRLSSLKRPAKSNTCQSSVKESKIPRTPITKPRQSVVAASNKTAGHSASHLKQTHVAQPVASSRLNVGPNRSTKFVPNKVKSGSGSTSNKETNEVRLPNQFPSSTSSQPTLSKKVNNSDPKVTNHDGPSFVVHPSVGQDKSTAPETSLPPKGLIIGTDTQRRQMKSIKPSGLRLPSPSIGFFSQPKSAVPQCISSSTAVQGGFSGLRETGGFRPGLPRVEVSEVKAPKTIKTELIASKPDTCRVLDDKIEEESVDEFMHEGNLISLDVFMPSEPRRDELVANSSSEFSENVVCAVQSGSENSTGTDGAVDVNKLLVESKSSGNMEEDSFLYHDFMNSPGCRQSTGSCQEESTVAQQNKVVSAGYASGARSWNYESCDENKEKPSECVLTDHCVLFKSQSEEGFACSAQCLAARQNLFVQDFRHTPKNCSESHGSSPDKSFSIPRRDQHLLPQVGSFNGQLEDLKDLVQENISDADSSAPDNAEPKLGKTELRRQSKILNSLADNSKGDDDTLISLFQEREILADVFLTPRRCQENANQCSQIGGVDPSGKALSYKTTNLELIPVITGGIPASSSILVEKGVVSKEALHFIEELPPAVTSELATSSDQTIQKTGITQTGGSDVDKGAIVGDPLSCLREVSTSLGNQHARIESISCNFNHTEVISLGLHSSSSEFSKISDANEHEKHNGDGPENLTTPSISNFNQRIANSENNCVSADREVLKEDGKCHFNSIEEADQILQAFSSQSENTVQLKTKEKEIADYPTLSRMEDEQVQHVGGKLAVECSINCTSGLCDQGVPLASCTRSSGQAELADSCTIIESVPLSNTFPHSSCWSGQRIAWEKFHETVIFESSLGFVPENSQHGGSESNCPSINVKCDNPDIVSSVSNVKNAVLGDIVEVEASTELDNLLTRKEINYDEGTGGETLLFASQGADELETSCSPDKIMSMVPEDIDCHVGDHNPGTDATLCAMEETDLMPPICSKKTADSSSKSTLKIIPPKDAAPFSDEWLAAFEAAGEDILAVKSGAVKNSPPEKVAPEPRPWSPVKRKNSSIGPFDCTKFTSH